VAGLAKKETTFLSVYRHLSSCRRSGQVLRIPTSKDSLLVAFADVVIFKPIYEKDVVQEFVFLVA